MARRYYRLNRFITADTVRVVGEQGKQIGVMPIAEALKAASEAGGDLVEIAPKANPPVAKIIDFKKFLFLEEKKEQEEKRKSKKVQIKEVRLTPFIGKNDFEFRLRRAEEFLKDGNKVRISVFFRGREITKKAFGDKILDQAQKKLENIATVEQAPKLMGRSLGMTMVPAKRGTTKGGKNGKEKNESEKVSQPQV